MVLYLSLSRAELTHTLASLVTHPYVVLPSLLFVVFLSGSPRAPVEKPKGPSRRSSRAEKEVEEEPVADSGIRKRSARPGTSAAVKGNLNTPAALKDRISITTSKLYTWYYYFFPNTLVYFFFKQKLERAPPRPNEGNLNSL